MYETALNKAIFIINGIAALVAVITLLYSLFRKKKGCKEELLRAVLIFAAAGPVLWIGAHLLPERIMSDSQLSIQYFLDSAGYMMRHTACFLFALYVSCRAGFEDQLKRHIRLCALPLVLDLGFLITGCLPLIFPGGAFPPDLRLTMNICASVLYYLCLAVVMVMLWRIYSVLVILPIILISVKAYFFYVLYDIHISDILLVLCIIYVYFSLEWKSILIHLGGIILTLGFFNILIIGNMVTSSAFVSYLRTIHDRNNQHITEVLEYMDQFKSLPWLMQYWIEHADTIAAETDAKYDDEFYAEYGEQFKNISSEQAAKLPEGLQYFYAKACYDHVSDMFTQQFKVHNLDDLFLIVPDENKASHQALILFDAEKDPDGSYRIGQYRDLTEETREWNNYANAITGRNKWVWGRYSDEDDFGFYREFSFGDKGQKAYVCNSFKRSEVYAHLDFISASRFRAIRYMIVVGAAILVTLYFMVIRPLTSINSAVRRYEEDKDPDAVRSDMSAIRSLNEIGALSDEFSSLANEMEKYTTEVAQLAVEKERVKTELRLAYDIQSSALPGCFPAFPDRDDFDIYASMKPAKAVGGDFYDFFLIEDDTRLAFFIADVSGKGVPAALFMMSAKNLLDYRTHEGGTPGEILTAVNDMLCMNNEAEMFVTVWLGILDPATRMLKYASAGHEPPAIKTGGKDICLYDRESCDLAMGVMPGIIYSEYEIKLDPGSTVFVYTDGVTDAKDADENFYGTERLLSCLHEAENDTPKDMVQKVIDSIASHVQGAEQFDDITMLCVKLGS